MLTNPGGIKWRLGESNSSHTHSQHYPWPPTNTYSPVLHNHTHSPGQNPEAPQKHTSLDKIQLWESFCEPREWRHRLTTLLRHHPKMRMLNRNSGSFRFTHSSPKSLRRFSRIASLLSSVKPDAVTIYTFSSFVILFRVRCFSFRYRLQFVARLSRVSNIHYVLYSMWKGIDFLENKM